MQDQNTNAPVNSVEPNSKIIQLSNGKTAIAFIPEITGELAIVDLNVLKRLTSLLPTTSINGTIKRLKENLEYVLNLDEYVKVLKDEVAFHETCNLITLYEKPVDKEQEYAKEVYA